MDVIKERLLLGLTALIDYFLLDSCEIYARIMVTEQGIVVVRMICTNCEAGWETDNLRTITVLIVFFVGFILLCR